MIEYLVLFVVVAVASIIFARNIQALFVGYKNTAEGEMHDAEMGIGDTP